MEANERIDFLIRNLEGGIARRFVEKTGISEPTLCKMRKGTLNAGHHYEKILAAYPCINREWLYDGRGYPGDLNVQMVRDRLESVIATKDIIIERLSAEIERQGRIIDNQE